MSCLTSDILERLALGFLEDEREARAHLAGCGACAKRLSALDAEHAALASASKDIRLPRVRKPSPSLAWKPWVAAAVVLFGVAVLFFPGATVMRARMPKLEAEYRSVASKPAPKVSLSTKITREAEARALERPIPSPEPARDMVFKEAPANPTVDTTRDTLSTFALDVDSASYTLMRGYLERGVLPPPESVRVEEYVNYFRYPDPAPNDASFLIRLEAAPSPFVKGKHLLRVALRSKEPKAEERQDAVLTFIIDVSGSMAQENRLGLVQRSLRHLVDRLRPSDRVALVVYGSSAREVLPHTPLAEREAVLRAIDALRPEGSTNVEDGLRYGYRRAALGFEKGKTNRVILCSDGVANNGVTDPELLLNEVKKHAGDAIFLSTVGFGMGNFNDALMERLANGGNGHYAYVDDFNEAKRMFGTKLTTMMDVLALDAKVQVEFDPMTVASFRQIGYENRRLAHEDFRNDKVDAGELGPGHQVTALYELELKPEAVGRLVTARLRYREPATKEQVELQESTGRAQVKAAWTETTPQWRLAAAVAAYAEILKGSMNGVGLEAVAETAEPAVAELQRPEEGVEFVRLLKKAAQIRR